MIALGSVVLGLMCHIAPAQTAPKAAPAPGAPPPAARKYETAPPKEQAVSTKQLEEALRRLLRADSVQTRRFRPTEIEGLIVDQTLTKVGHDFYDVFYTTWEAPPGATDFTVTLRERIGRGTSTLVTVDVNDTELLELPLQPKFDLVEAAAQEAVAVAQDFLRSAQTVTKQLDRADQAGAGLF